MGEKFCLRWRDFETSVSASFRELRGESEFFDLTLGCSDPDGRTIQAHKVILSACSSYFKTLLRQYTEFPKPFVYLKGVSYKNLSCILDFMYNGEVTVLQENLDAFLTITGELKIKGLVNKDGSIIGSNLESSETKVDAAPVFVPPFLRNPSTESILDLETINVDGEPTYDWYDDEKAISGVKEGENEDIKEDPADAFMSLEDNRWVCKACQIPFKSISHCRQHVEDKHVFVPKDTKSSGDRKWSYNCSHCSFECKSKVRLECHETSKHAPTIEIKNEYDSSVELPTKRKTRTRINYAEEIDDKPKNRSEVKIAKSENEDEMKCETLNDGDVVVGETTGDVDDINNNNVIDKKETFLKYHLIEHFNDTTKRTRCTECDKVFSSWPGAKQHLLIVHNDHPMFYECTLCQKIIKSKQMFRIHVGNKHELKGVKNIVGTYGKEVEEYAYLDQKIPTE